ncbi:N-acetyltransferase [Paenibacillus sp. J2TS4]|uniref:GNAT family N-acetyltransferase n=1 Tax=Paenibacillus sp. J2TS4 TaxID=2807194 RepID=UPI001B03213F|nr:GNAT family N-acetyltransferase [Paenibacillus sp. J2TS4]GIP35455.1 N-acetyltransferase [Paenibacillus sp. J2TS4]
MIEQIRFNHNEEALRVLQLQMQAYMVEADRIGFFDIPPLKETIASLQESRESFYGFFPEGPDGELAGAIAYDRAGDTVTICRLMVRPSHFRQGIASELLRFVERMESDCACFCLTAAVGNEPAIRLYKKHGYAEAGSQEVAPGVVLLRLMKRTTEEIDSQNC